MWLLSLLVVGFIWLLDLVLDLKPVEKIHQMPFDR